MPIPQKILVAVDGTETARRAVRYVGDLAGGLRGLEICLLHIYPEPPPDYEREGRTLAEYRAAVEETAGRILAEAVELLGRQGIAPANIQAVCRMASSETLSQAILRAQAEGGYGTVVVGKRGVSKAEEFLFGSISSALSHGCSKFTLWVVG